MQTANENPWGNSQEISKSDLTPQLYAVTRQLLTNRVRTLTLERIAKDTGLKEAWLSRVIADKSKNPNADSVEILYRYLSGKNPNF